MKINVELLTSWTFKIVPIVMAFLVGRDMASQAAADQLPGLLDNTIRWGQEGLLLVTGWITLVRSWKTHGAK